MNKYNEELKEKDITLKDFLNHFDSNSATFVKIDNELIQIKKVEVEYLDKLVAKFDLIPFGGVIYLKD